jgi:hypothetical protein
MLIYLEGTGRPPARDFILSLLLSPFDPSQPATSQSCQRLARDCLARGELLDEGVCGALSNAVERLLIATVIDLSMLSSSSETCGLVIVLSMLPHSDPESDPISPIRPSVDPRARLLVLVPSDRNLVLTGGEVRYGYGSVCKALM